MNPRYLLLLAIALLSWLPQSLTARSERPFVAHQASPGAVILAGGSRVAAVYVDGGDWAGVVRAAHDLQDDFERVTGKRPDLNLDARPEGTDLILVGTVGRSGLIDALAAEGKIDTKGLVGQWEGYLIRHVVDPFPGVARALVIAGSDKRGTIFGIYELSEQIGVSPWYWWADVPPARNKALYVPEGTRFADAPAVRYRGIFINDEAPALSGWAGEKFGGTNHEMYEKVFELILRLKGNYLWPAMWGRSFFDDDPKNAPLADLYGVVIGTSHHEPMMRAHVEWSRYGEGPWDYSLNPATLQAFWREGLTRVADFEKIVSLGMRGDGDEAMSEEANIGLLERVVEDQRAILAQVQDQTLAETPQLWALYKEVQGYYEQGMRVPDDVTLLWADDNWGNIRRLPTPAERDRSGGAGVYYHFDYVGGPRNYKWMNVTPISKVWEQMHLAWEYGADRIWIVNVGDIKPMEFPLEFFLSYAWDPESWPYDRLTEYSEAWAEQNFGPEHAVEIASLINAYSKLNRQRTPELLAPDTYHLVHYGEADRVLQDWRDLGDQATRVSESLDSAYRAAFYQLVLYPVKASANVRELLMAAGLNELYARQGRVAATAVADRVQGLFAMDRILSDDYHQLVGGKWNHMMSEKKFGYAIWQTPGVETTPPLVYVRPNLGADPALAVEGSAVAWPGYGLSGITLPVMDAFRRNARWIELFNRGDTAFGWQASTDTPWLRIWPDSGLVNEVQRLSVAVDWDSVPAGQTQGAISITTDTGRSFTVEVPVENRLSEVPAGWIGFVECEGFVSIEAPHHDRLIEDDEAGWLILPDHGRTVGGVTVEPVTAGSRIPGGDSPRIDYDVFLFSSGSVDVEVHLAPSLDFNPDNPLQFALSFDDQAPVTIDLGTRSTDMAWQAAVSDSVRRVVSRHEITEPGSHTLKFWMVTPGVVLHKILIDTGGLKPSYLGPPESPRMGGDG